ncbi:hypothetical protein V6C53_12855 [Desulfocurvibacter africanus]
MQEQAFFAEETGDESQAKGQAAQQEEQMAERCPAKAYPAASLINDDESLRTLAFGRLSKRRLGRCKVEPRNKKT